LVLHVFLQTNFCCFGGGKRCKLDKAAGVVRRASYSRRRVRTKVLIVSLEGEKGGEKRKDLSSNREGLVSLALLLLEEKEN